MGKEKLLGHVLVPEHEIVLKEDEEKLLSELKATKSQLPIIFEDDPMAKDMGAKIGDIIAIRRSSPTAGEARYYRQVLERE